MHTINYNIIAFSKTGCFDGLFDSEVSCGSHNVYFTDIMFHLCNIFCGGRVLLLTNVNLQNISMSLQKYDDLLPFNVNIACCRLLFNYVSIYVFAVSMIPALNTEYVRRVLDYFEAIDFVQYNLFILLGDLNFSGLGIYHLFASFCRLLMNCKIIMPLKILTAL